MTRSNLASFWFVALACLLIAGCSKENSTSSNAPTSYLGERLLKIVDSNPSVSPLPASIKEAIPECKFEELDGGAITFSNNCTIIKSAPKRTNSDEKAINIAAETPRCCLSAVLISQSNSDNDGGLFLFSNIEGITTKPLQCDNMEDAKLSLVEKNGAPKFVIAEYVSSGSGGTSVDTAIFYGKTILDCDYFAAKEKSLYKAQNSSLKNVSIANSSGASTNAFAQMDNTQFQICNAYDIIFRAESLFANVKYNEKLLMQELQVFTAEKNSRGISDSDLNVVVSRIKNDINKRFNSPSDKLAFANKMSITCGQQNKL